MKVCKVIFSFFARFHYLLKILLNLSQTQNLNHQIDNIIAQIDKELNEAKTSFNDKIKEELENNKIILEKEVDLIEKDFEKKKRETKP